MEINVDDLDKLIGELGHHRDALAGNRAEPSTWLMLNHVHNVLIEFRSRQVGFDALRRVLEPVIRDIVKVELER
jgi:hypothetical protein